MKKFLTLLEEYDPENHGDPRYDLLEHLKSKGIDASKDKKSGAIRIVCEGKSYSVKVEADAEEDAESVQAGYGDYDVNAEVEGLADKAQSGLKGIAGKVFGTDAQRAKGAIAKRAAVARQAVGVYDKKTQKLKQDLANAT